MKAANVMKAGHVCRMLRPGVLGEHDVSKLLGVMVGSLAKGLTEPIGGVHCWIRVLPLGGKFLTVLKYRVL